jgi:hypothetical protein
LNYSNLTLSSLLFGLYLDVLEGRLDDEECDAPTLANMHIWLLFFANDLALTSKLKVRLQKQLKRLGGEELELCKTHTHTRRQQVLQKNNGEDPSRAR